MKATSSVWQVRRLSPRSILSTSLAVWSVGCWQWPLDTIGASARSGFGQNQSGVIRESPIPSSGLLGEDQDRHGDARQSQISGVKRCGQDVRACSYARSTGRRVLPSQPGRTAPSRGTLRLNHPRPRPWQGRGLPASLCGCRPIRFPAEEVESGKYLAELRAFVEPSCEVFGHRLLAIGDLLKSEPSVYDAMAEAAAGVRAETTVPAAVYAFLPHPRSFRCTLSGRPASREQ